MPIFNKLLLTSTVVALFFASSISAEISKTRHSPLNLSSDLVPSGQPTIVNRRINTHIRGVGRVAIHINRVIEVDVVPTLSSAGAVLSNPQEIKLVRGKAVIKGFKSRVAGSVYQIADQYYLHLSFPVKDPRSQRVTLNKLKIKLNRLSATTVSRAYRVAKLPHDAFVSDQLVVQDQHFFDHYHHLSALIDVAGDTEIRSTASVPTTAAAKSLKIVKLNIDADSAWHAEFGASSNAELTAYLNEAESIYESELGITFDVVRQNVFTGRSFGADTAADVLCNYQYYTTGSTAIGAQSGCTLTAAKGPRSYFGNADAYHLFTGKNLSGSTIGLAYVGVVCRSERNAFGISQYTNSSVTPITFAHELGHNFSAIHDGTASYNGYKDIDCSQTSSSGFVMGAVVGGNAPDDFSACSDRGVAAYLSLYDSCLETSSENQDPSQPPVTRPPVETSLTVNNINLSASVNRKGIVNIASNFSSANSIAEFAGCNVDLLFSKKARKVYSSKIVKSFPIDSYFLSAKTTLKKTIKKNRRGKRRNAFVAARISCGETAVAESNTVKLKTKGIKSRRSLALKRYLVKLVQKL